MSDAKTTGSCQCGAVTYELTGEPMFAAHCCCNSCKKASGADHITAAFYSDDQIELKGDVSSYSAQADSGATSTRHFCPTCGSRLFSTNSGRAGVKGFQVGTMDNPSGIQPRAVVYSKDKNAWDSFNEALPQFEKMPPPPPAR